MSKEQWIDWPTEPGMYWFYGHTDWKWSEKFNVDFQLIVVNAAATADNSLAVYSSEILYRSRVKGKFLPLAIPDNLPEI